MSRDLFLQGYGQVGGLDFNPFRSHKGNKKIISLKKKKREMHLDFGYLWKLASKFLF